MAKNEIKKDEIKKKEPMEILGELYKLLNRTDLKDPNLIIAEASKILNTNTHNYFKIISDISALLNPIDIKDVDLQIKNDDFRLRILYLIFDRESLRRENLFLRNRINELQN